MELPSKPGELTRSAKLSQSDDQAAEWITAGQLALEVMHEIRNPLEALGHLTYLT